MQALDLLQRSALRRPSQGGRRHRRRHALATVCAAVVSMLSCSGFSSACLEEERCAEPFEKRPAVNAKEKESGSTPC